MTRTTHCHPSVVICGGADGFNRKLEKVRFGAKIEEACPNGIPPTLLVLLLKVNKDGPSKKDIWRAPGNHSAIRTLARSMREGALVNVANFDEKTVASVIKLFLSKIPGGILGPANEETLLSGFPEASPENQRQLFCRVVSSLCLPSQHLMVLLIGTFRMVAEYADGGERSKMTPDALGISVAPSLFHTCLHLNQSASFEAQMAEVKRSKTASEIISKVIQNFGHFSLFPREMYEFYARMTGRTIRFDENTSTVILTNPHLHDWPVPPSTPFSRMAVKCAGSYSLSAVSGLEQSTDFSNRILVATENETNTKTMIPGSFRRPSPASETSIDGGYGHTYFGTGPNPVTVATVSDEIVVAEDCLRQQQNRSRNSAAAAVERTTSAQFDLDISVSNSCDF